jgi:N-acetylmuramic acid 6-phosphate etherase
VTGPPDRIDLSSLATELRNPASTEIDTLDTVDLVSVINKEDRKVAAAVGEELPNIAAAVDAITSALRDGGRLVYVGAGTSGRLGVLDASECPPTFNTDPNMVIGLIAGGDHALRHPIEHVEDQPESGAKALQDIGLTGDDVVVGIAASGRTPFVLGAIEYARSVGATTIGLSNSPDSAIAAAADMAIAPVVGPEVITGSTRMKAGSAQKMVLNMLTTATMVKLGKTYGNLMVDVQPTNAKLRERAVRIVRESTGADDTAARDALERAAGDVKSAIVALVLGIDATAARVRLDTAHGVVRRALAEGAP